MTATAHDRRVVTRAIALAGAPLVWGVHLGGTYALVPVACRWGTKLPLHAGSVVALVLALGATAVAARESRGSGDGVQWFPPPAATVVSALFSFAIFLTELAVLLVDPCLS